MDNIFDDFPACVSVANEEEEREHQREQREQQQQREDDRKPAAATAAPPPPSTTTAREQQEDSVTAPQKQHETNKKTDNDKDDSSPATTKQQEQDKKQDEPAEKEPASQTKELLLTQPQQQETEKEQPKSGVQDQELHQEEAKDTEEPSPDEPTKPLLLTPTEQRRARILSRTFGKEDKKRKLIMATAPGLKTNLTRAAELSNIVVSPLRKNVHASSTYERIPIVTTTPPRKTTSAVTTPDDDDAKHATKISGGSRRSSPRTRVKPLQFWKNEKFIYGPNEDPNALIMAKHMPVPKAIVRRAQDDDGNGNDDDDDDDDYNIMTRTRVTPSPKNKKKRAAVASMVKSAKSPKKRKALPKSPTKAAARSKVLSSSSSPKSRSRIVERKLPLTKKPRTKELVQYYEEEEEESVVYQQDEEESVVYQQDEEESVVYQQDEEESVVYHQYEEESVVYHQDEDNREVEEDDEEEEPTTPRRRSRRMRSPPLAFWKNERISERKGKTVISSGSKVSSKPKRMVASKSILPKKAKPTFPARAKSDGRRRRRGVKKTQPPSPPRRQSTGVPPLLDYSGYPYISGESTGLWNLETQQVEDTKAIAYHENVEYRPLPRLHQGERAASGEAAQAFGFQSPPGSHLSGFLAGHLTLPPLGVKDHEPVGACTHIFTVVKGHAGAVEVAYAAEGEEFRPDTALRFLVGAPGDLFRVPAGNRYRLENLSPKISCQFTWTIIRPHVPGIVNKDDSSDEE